MLLIWRLVDYDTKPRWTPVHHDAGDLYYLVLPTNENKIANAALST